MKTLLLTSTFLLAISLQLTAQVSVTTDGSSPDPSAMLDVKSTAKGMLIPRMTSTQRTGISSPAVGLLLYDLTTESFWFYNTGGWIEIVAGNEFNPAVIHDADNDTKIQTEKNADENVIRFDLGGTEKMVLTGNRLEIGDANRNLFLGQSAGLTNTGTDNSGLGFQSLYYNGTGNENTAIGTQSLLYNVSGSRNTATGYRSLLHNTEGSFNTATGFQSMHDNLTGNYNSALGFYSLILNKYGSYNTGLGCFASYFNQFGSKNTAVGYSALYSSNMGNSSVAIGYGAGYYETYDNRLYIDNQTRSNLNDGRSKALIYGIFDADPANQKLTFNATVGIGTTGPTNKLHVIAASNPLRLEGLQTTASADVLVVDANGVVSKRAGSFGSSGWALTGNTGTDPVVNFIGTTDSVELIFRTNNKKAAWLDMNRRSASFGYSALYANTTGTRNAALGYYSLSANTTGYENSAVGYKSLASNTTGNRNSAHGASALCANTTGTDNTAVGYGALDSNTTGRLNTAIGGMALYYNNTGWRNTAIGKSALYSNTYASDNTAVGFGTLYYSDGGSYNTALGMNALYYNVANSRSTAIGYYALFNADNQSYGRETFNTAVGYESMKGGTEPSYNGGQYNTAVGDQSLYSFTSGYGNAAYGYQSLYMNSYGFENTAIGYMTLNSNELGTRNVALGAYSGYYETGDNKLYIDNQLRTDLSESRGKALIYGVFDAEPANQKITFNASVGINTTAPDSSAVLDVSSTTKGLLPPRMTAAQRDLIANPAEGLIIYNTSVDKFEYYNGTTWKTLISTISSAGSSAEGSGFCSEGVTDYDGHHYKSLKIGDQCWMAENLKSTHYSTGAAISEAYAYDNQESYALTYGRLYTWAAVMNGAASSDANPSGVQGVCPAGWHVPSDAEWKELEMTLGMSQPEANATGYRGTHGEGIKLKETDDAFLWTTGSEAAGNNASGFSGLPGGLNLGTIYDDLDVGINGRWWTSTEYDVNNAWCRGLGCFSPGVYRFSYLEVYRLSVRCLRD